MNDESRNDFADRTHLALRAGTPPPLKGQTPAPHDRPSPAEAEAAVRTLIRWAGDDPDREGLRDTPGRVARSYQEMFAGYEVDPREYLERTFEEVGGYDQLVVLRDIRFVSFSWICNRRAKPRTTRASLEMPTTRRVGR